MLMDNWNSLSNSYRLIYVIGVFYYFQSRGLIGSTSVILRYYALQYLTIADTSVITYSTPVLVTVMAHFFLGEKCGVVPIIVAFTTLVGVGIVTKPPLLTGAESFDTNTLVIINLHRINLTFNNNNGISFSLSMYLDLKSIQISARSLKKLTSLFKAV